MKITGGVLSGRKIKVPRKIRPTSGMVRKAIFDILKDKIREARVLELFAGSGIFGFEAISRGAKEAILVEKNPAVFKVLAQNVFELNLQDRIVLFKKPVEKVIFSLKGSFDLIFADPPYRLKLSEKIFNSIIEKLLLDGIFILEHSKHNTIQFPFIREVVFGDTVLSFFTRRISGKF